MRENLLTITKGGLTALYRRETESGVVELLLLPADLPQTTLRTDCAAEPLVQLKLLGDDAPTYFSQGRTMRNGPSVRALRFSGQRVEEQEASAQIVTTLTDPRGYLCRHILRLHGDTGTAEVTTEFENQSTAPVTLEMLSSFSLGSLSPFSTGLAPGTLRIHRLRSSWSAEGRLVTETAESLQLEPSWKQFSANSLRFGSVGSFPVRGYVPFCAVEDAVHSITWAAATTQGSSWQMELYRQDDGLSLSGGLADREFGHWTKCVAPGGCFAAPAAVLTAVHGSVHE
ncbi:MAG: alpha-galactosidase, partial [Faecalibacterium sp.]